MGGLSEFEVDAIDRWVHPAALGRLCDEVEQIVARHVAAALTEAAEEAASALGHERGGHTSTYSVRRWLQEKAKAAAPPP